MEDEEHWRIGVNKYKNDLVRFVNGTLDRMRADGTWMRPVRPVARRRARPDRGSTPGDLSRQHRGTGVGRRRAGVLAR